jgi:hypothetical protein
MKYMIIILLLAFITLFAGSKPHYEQVVNSYGYSGMRVRDDSLNIDTTGSSAWKSVVNDTSNAIVVEKVGSVIFSYTLALAQTDSASFNIVIGCYDDGLDQWLWTTDYTQNNPYGADSMITTYTLDTNTTGYGRRELQATRCDQIKFVFSAPAEASNADTVTIGSRYLRLQD